MHSFLIPNNQTKEETYKSLLPQLEALLEHDIPCLSNMSNFIAALKETFGWWWIGFYFVHQNELILGPFQGPIACTRIAKGKGVCGTSWIEKKIMIVPDVNKFPGHIACSTASQSEIVLPIMIDNSVIGVLDIDSENLNQFDLTDQIYLEKAIEIMAPILANFKLS